MNCPDCNTRTKVYFPDDPNNELGLYARECPQCGWGVIYRFSNGDEDIGSICEDYPACGHHDYRECREYNRRR